MARPRKMISLEEQIKKQEETVLKVKEKYDSEMMKLKNLYAKRNEEKKKERYCSKVCISHCKRGCKNSCVYGK